MPYYHRISDATTAIRTLDLGAQVRFSFELTSEWYDPPDGIVPQPAADAVVRGSHAVPLTGFDRTTGRFTFPNSWGEEWGDKGWGSINREFFDARIVEAWTPCFHGFGIPYESKEGIVCLEWKCTPDEDFGVHCREIVAADTDTRLAWAFCFKRNGMLDIEDVFVWPTERGKGYGRELVRMLLSLRRSTKLPLRLLVSFADTTPRFLPGVIAIARRLNLGLFEARERWVHLIGMHAAPAMEELPELTRKPPFTPAFQLEKLWPTGEPPHQVSFWYPVLFGTDRQIAKKGFSGRRGNCLTLGTIHVHIPEAHRFGSVGRWWFRVWERWSNTGIKVSVPYLIPEKQFVDLLTTIRKGFKDRPQNLLYIHGYNTTFIDAVTQAARFGIDLKVPGTTFAYSWPSAGRPTWYATDEGTIDASIPHLSDFVDLILTSERDVPLHILVHSMGSRVLLRYLESLATRPSAGRLGHLIFAAPDVDHQVFVNSTPHFANLPETVTLYATDRDRRYRCLNGGTLIRGLARSHRFSPSKESIRLKLRGWISAPSGTRIMRPPARCFTTCLICFDTVALQAIGQGSSRLKPKTADVIGDCQRDRPPDRSQAVALSNGLPL